MKKEYIFISVEITKVQDVVSTSNEVETEKVKFADLYDNETFNL